MATRDDTGSNPRLACAYGGHDWVDLPGGAINGVLIRFRECTVCGAVRAR